MPEKRQLLVLHPKVEDLVPVRVVTVVADRLGLALGVVVLGPADLDLVGNIFLQITLTLTRTMTVDPNLDERRHHPAQALPAQMARGQDPDAEEDRVTAATAAAVFGEHEVGPEDVAAVAVGEETAAVQLRRREKVNRVCTNGKF